MKKALIEDKSKTVVNIIETDESGIRGLQFPLGFRLLDCTNYDVRIGDTVINNDFYRANVALPYVPTAEERLVLLNKEMQEKQTQTDTAIAELSMMIATMGTGGSTNV